MRITLEVTMKLQTIEMQKHIVYSIKMFAIILRFKMTRKKILS